MQLVRKIHIFSKFLKCKANKHDFIMNIHLFYTFILKILNIKQLL